MFKTHRQVLIQTETDPQNIDLPENQHELLQLWETQNVSFVRICVLSKLKNIIIIDNLTKYEQSRNNYNDQFLSGYGGDEVVKKINKQIKERNSLYSALFLKLLKKGFKSRVFPDEELRLMLHVISLRIKYFFSQDDFKSMCTAITDYIDTHKERIFIAVQFFTEVIQTIEYNHEECLPIIEDSNSNMKKDHCRFQRHFVAYHLNSMLMIANFFMSKFVLKDESAIEDGYLQERFKLRAQQSQIQKVLNLLHRVISFDYLGQNYSLNQEANEFSAIVIPTKNPKNVNGSEFQKWIKNTQWIRVYQILYDNSNNLKLKLSILQIFGDMGRIHMKFFKNKVNFKTHFQNIVFSFASILNQFNINQSNKGQAIQIAIAIGYNLVKLTGPLTIPIFFDINPNIARGLFDNLRDFLVHQIFQQNIFNSNVVFYFFKFLENITNRIQFQKNPFIQQYVESNVKQICRNFQYYLHLLVEKAYKKECSPNKYDRNSYVSFRQMLDTYSIEDLNIYFSPFKIMKPRKTQINHIYNLVVFLCAKVQRSIYMLDSYRLQTWELQVSIGMISQAIQKIVQWYSFTSYAKKYKKNSKGKHVNQHDTQSVGSSHQQSKQIKSRMETIVQVYNQQIQNEQQYCHLLRIIIFFTINLIHEKQFMKKHVYKDHKLMKLISVGIQLCFFSDLNQNQSRQKGSPVAIQRIHQFLELSLLIIQASLKCSWENDVEQISKQANQIYNYRPKFNLQEIQFIEIVSIDDKFSIFEKIGNICIENSENFMQPLKTMQIYLGYNISKELNRKMPQILPIKSLIELKIYLKALQHPIIQKLIECEETIIISYVNYIKDYLGNYQLKNDTSQIINYIQCIIEMKNLKHRQIRQEFTNKLFTVCKQLIFLVSNNQQQYGIEFNEDLIAFMDRLNSDILCYIRDLSFQELCRQIKQIVDLFNQQKIINQPPKCPSFEDHLEQNYQIQINQCENIQQFEDQTQILGQNFSNNTGKQDICDNSISQSQDQVFDIKPIHRQQKTFVMDQQEKMSSQQFISQPSIYLGYHKQKIDSMLNKYIDQDINRQTPQKKCQNSQNLQSLQRIHANHQNIQEKQSPISNVFVEDMALEQNNTSNHNLQQHIFFDSTQKNSQKLNLEDYNQLNQTKQSEFQKDSEPISHAFNSRRDYVKQIQKMVSKNQNHLELSSEFIGDLITQLQEINQDNAQDLISNDVSNKEACQNQPLYQQQQILLQNKISQNNANNPLIDELKEQECQSSRNSFVENQSSVQNL